MSQMTKSIAFDDAHVKFSNDREGVFEGYASIFENVDADGDVMKSGAFSDVLRRGEHVAMFFNHDKFGIPIGKWTNLEEDSRGLYAKGELTVGNSQSNDIRAAMKHGTVSGLSVGFRVEADGLYKTDTGHAFTRIAKLFEISLCTFPANDQATLTAIKSMDGIFTLSDAEDWLRDAAGLSRKQAQTFISRLKSAIRSDSEGPDLSDDAEKIVNLLKNFHPLETSK